MSRYRSILAGSEVALKEDAVFLADNGQPLTIWGVSTLFKRVKKLTGITGKRVSTHNCLRYMAKTQLASDHSPLDVRRRLGHSTLKMTDHYTSLIIHQLTEIT